MAKFNTRYMAKIAVMGVLSFLIMLIEVPLWFTPEFLKMDLSDLPAIVGAMALGPLAGILIELLKVFLKLVTVGTTTAGVGELANFVVGSVFSVTAALVYRSSRRRRGIIAGLAVGTLVMAVLASVINYTVLLPFYSKAYGLKMTGIISQAKAVNPYVVDLRSFITFGIFPFNLFKGIVISVISYPVYIRLRKIIEV